MIEETTKLDSVSFAISDGLHWFGAIPRRAIHVGGDVIDFDGPWDGYVAALKEQVDGGVFRPSMNQNHVKDSRSLGIVEETRVLSPEQAAELGITGATVPMIYMGVRPSTDGALDGVEYVSIGALFGHVDETGREWPIYLHELSAVDTPHIRTDQTPASELRGIQFSISLAEVEPPHIPEGTMTPEEIEAMTAELAAVRTELAAAKETIAEMMAKEEEASMDAEAGDAVAAAGITDAADAAALKLVYRQDESEGKATFALVAEKFKPEPAALTAEEEEVKFALAGVAKIAAEREAGRAGTPDPEAVEMELMRGIDKNVKLGMSYPEARRVAKQEMTNV